MIGFQTKQSKRQSLQAFSDELERLFKSFYRQGLLTEEEFFLGKKTCMAIRIQTSGYSRKLEAKAQKLQNKLDRLERLEVA